MQVSPQLSRNFFFLQINTTYISSSKNFSTTDFWSSKKLKFRILHKNWIFMSLFGLKLSHLGPPVIYTMSIWSQHRSRKLRFTIPYNFKKAYGCLHCHLVIQKSVFRIFNNNLDIYLCFFSEIGSFRGSSGTYVANMEPKRSRTFNHTIPSIFKKT